MALGLDTFLTSQHLAGTAFSGGCWQQIVTGLGGSFEPQPNQTILVTIGLGKLFGIAFVFSCFAALVGGWLIAIKTKQPLGQSISRWVFAGWWWWMIPGVWEIFHVVFALYGGESLNRLIIQTALFLFCICGAGWAATFCFQLFEQHNKTISLSDKKPANSRTALLFVTGCIAVYVIVFTVMNWQLYNGLLVPHGDSVMYEEHLWNITHNKGFRSYLDQGLFLGEHIQVVHLLLLPIYSLFPSHFTLELCESFALAITALPLFYITKRHTSSNVLALLMAVAYLLYVPMHYLDIAIDLKTFRPISFGIPFMLFGIDQYERRRFGWMALLFLLALSAKEEFAIVIAMFGLWVFFDRTTFGSTDNNQTEPSYIKRQRLLGGCLAVAGVVYLVLAVGVIIPWFRDGAKVHYSAYFGELGKSPTELVKNSILHPLLFAQQLLTTRTVFYSLSLLMPLGFLPLFSFKRLLVAVPSFGILSLMTIDLTGNDVLIPLHHFHAPLIPIILWAACAGLANVQPRLSWVANKINKLAFLKNASPEWAAWFAVCSAVSIGLFMGYAPSSISFWDHASSNHWQQRYVPSERAKQFEKVIKQIPQDAIVASTDFVHPRFTHHKRSYDYSHFLRKVSNYEDRVPHDTDYIVIDTIHRYSDIKDSTQLRELQQHPNKWKLLPDTTNGHYIILKRR